MYIFIFIYIYIYIYIYISSVVLVYGGSFRNLFYVLAVCMQFIMHFYADILLLVVLGKMFVNCSCFCLKLFFRMMLA